jgi:alpha-beta hydrolase superfamily lysophospholipase
VFLSAVLDGKVKHGNQEGEQATMSEQRRWAIGIATSTGIVGLTVTGSLALLAHLFVNEFSRPHSPLQDIDLTWDMPESIGEPPTALQRSLLFKASDGTLLCGDFWAQQQPAPTIVLCHGFRISRAHLRPAAELHYAYGFNVLFFDFRGHGDSDSVLTSAGNAEVLDLEAALFAASQQPETLPSKIIIHGFSMGASVALLTPPHPEVVAIIADSPYARSDDIMRRVVYQRLLETSYQWLPLFRPLRYLFPAITWCTVGLCTIDFRLRFGFSVVARPVASFKHWRAARSKHALHQQAIPILLIHSAGDTLIPIEHAYQIVAEAKAHNVTLETYFVEHVNHCGAYGYHPLRYTSVIHRFLSRHLQDDTPGQQDHLKVS